MVYISEKLYRKQGTTFPICLILIDGKRDWVEDKKHQPARFNPDTDTPVETFNSLFERMMKHLETTPTQQDNDLELAEIEMLKLLGEKKKLNDFGETHGLSGKNSLVYYQMFDENYDCLIKDNENPANIPDNTHYKTAIKIAKMWCQQNGKNVYYAQTEWISAMEQIIF